MGSRSQAIEFAAAGLTYHPAGQRHVVDPGAEMNRGAGAIAYAACGRAVHVWPALAFDPHHPEAHHDCAPPA